MSKRVFIGVGHGGSDPGACANGLRESDANLTMALAMKQVLEQAGVIVGISRTRDEDDRLAEEIRECNAFGPDLAVEVHNNAGGGDGFECYINGRDQTARQLAERIETEVKGIGQNSRGVKVSTSLGWVNKVKAPAVLCEGFFLDSDDRLIADTAEKQRRFGQAYARAVLTQLGIPQENGNMSQQEDDMDNTKFKGFFDEMRKGWQDNDAGAWSAEARQWAVDTGLIAGNGQTVDGQPNYMWGDMLTREQLVTVLYRFAQMMGKA